MSANAKKPGAFTPGFSINKGTPAAGQDVKTIARSQQAIQQNQPKHQPISWTWRGDNFIQIEAGTYSAICRRWAGPHWIPAYRRYGFRLFFYVLAVDVEVTMFINFGVTPQPPKSVASRYFQAWTIANGEAPMRGQPITPDVFLVDGLLYTVEVADAKINPTTKKDKPPCLVYSRVKEILSVVRQ